VILKNVRNLVTSIARALSLQLQCVIMAGFQVKKQIVDLLVLIVFMIMQKDTEDHGVSIPGQQSVARFIDPEEYPRRLIVI
jgi:hypothetical protein